MKLLTCQFFPFSNHRSQQLLSVLSFTCSWLSFSHVALPFQFSFSLNLPCAKTCMGDFRLSKTQEYNQSQSSFKNRVYQHTDYLRMDSHHRLVKHGQARGNAARSFQLLYNSYETLAQKMDSHFFFITNKNQYRYARPIDISQVIYSLCHIK